MTFIDLDQGLKSINLKAKLSTTFKTKSIINNNCNGKTTVKGAGDGLKEEVPSIGSDERSSRNNQSVMEKQEEFVSENCNIIDSKQSTRFDGNLLNCEQTDLKYQ